MSRRNQAATDPAWGAVVMINENWTPRALRRAFATELDGAGDLGDRRALGRAARALDAHLRDMHDTIAAGELEAWRTYLGEAVTGVSPLLLRVCDSAGMDLDTRVERLRPGAAWDPWVCGNRPSDVLPLGRKGSGWRRRPSRSASATADFQEYVHCGMRVRPESSSDLTFGMRVLNRGLEVAVDLGDHRVRTHGRTGTISLHRTKLNSTLRCGLPGHQLDALIDHRLLTGCGAVITGISDLIGASGTKVRFALDPVPWRVPWAR